MKYFFYVLIGLNLIIQNSIFSINILYITDNFPDHTSLPLIHCITGLLDRGHSVEIFSEKNSPEILSEKISPDMKKYQLNKRVYFKFLPNNLENFDLVICKDLFLAQKYLSIKKNYPRINFISHVNTGDITDKHINILNKKDLFKEIDMFLPISYYAKYQLLMLGCSARKIYVLYESVDCNECSFTMSVPYITNTIQILVDGYHFNQEDLEHIVQIAQDERLQQFDLRYVIICKNKVTKLFKDLYDKITQNYPISFVYNLSRENLLKLLENSYIIISTNATSISGVQRDISLLVKEAMAKGVFVIATRHASNSELIINNETGLIFPERDYQELVRKIRKAINEFGRWPSKLFMARELIQKKHSRDIIVSKLDKMIWTLVKK